MPDSAAQRLRCCSLNQGAVGNLIDARAGLQTGLLGIVAKAGVFTSASAWWGDTTPRL